MDAHRSRTDHRLNLRRRAILGLLRLEAVVWVLLRGRFWWTVVRRSLHSLRSLRPWAGMKGRTVEVRGVT
jgi:hypothetical protein